MCGIAVLSRAAGTSSIPDARRYVRALSLAIESRGRDATGFAWADEEGWPWFWKEPGPAAQVCWDAPLPVGMRRVLVHTRAATKGKPGINENNHPVVAPGVTLVHNGRCTNDDELFDLLGYERQATVDSEAIAALLSVGPEVLGATHPTQLLELVEGMAALAWLQGNENAVHLARLHERPLWIARTKRGDFVAASTKIALDHVERSCKVTLLDHEAVPVGTYLKVVDGQIVECKTFQPPKPPPVKYVPKQSSYPAPKQNTAAIGSRNPNWKPPTNNLTPPKPSSRSIYSEDRGSYYSRQAYLERLATSDRFDDEELALIEQRLHAQDTLDFEAQAVIGGHASDDDIDWDNLAPRRGWKQVGKGHT